MTALPPLKSPPRRPDPVGYPALRPVRPQRSGRLHVKPLPRASVRAAERIAERMFLLAGLTVAVYMGSSLVGHVFVENTRREGLAAIGRYREARRAEESLQQQVDALTSMGSIQSWAYDHGYYSPDYALEPGDAH